MAVPDRFTFEPSRLDIAVIELLNDPGVSGLREEPELLT
jgi:hypothetical protein